MERCDQCGSRNHVTDEHGRPGTRTPAQQIELESLRPTIKALRALADLIETDRVAIDLDDPNDEVTVFHGWNERGWPTCSERTARLLNGMLGNGPRGVQIDEWSTGGPLCREFIGRLLSMRVRVCTGADDPVSQAAADRIRAQAKANS